MQRPEVTEEDLTETKGRLGSSELAKSKTQEVMEECGEDTHKHTRTHDLTPHLPVIVEGSSLLFSVSGLAKITLWQGACVRGVSHDAQVSTPYTERKGGL